MMLAERYVPLKNIKYRGGKKAFFPGGVQFCCHQLACTSEFARRQVRALATSPPKHSFRAESFFWGGGVLLRIMMLAEQYVPLKNIAVSTSSCVRGHYLLTVNTYFFVSTILKVLPSFPSVSVWYLPRNTDRYQPNYTDYQEILTDTNQKIPTRYTTLVNT
jgi:hypothetical protein